MLHRFFTLTLAFALSATPQRAFSQSPSAAAQQSASEILNASQAGAILPASVFFRGQSASIQARNSAGVRFSKDALLLAALVDTSGYSSSVQQKYQAYLITESTIDIGGHHLVPGAYGFGFIANDTFIVMDIGGHDLFTAKSTRDAALRRPMPLQILPADRAHIYRLYEGRSFIEFSLAPPAVR